MDRDYRSVGRQRMRYVQSVEVKIVLRKAKRAGNVIILNVEYCLELQNMIKPFIAVAPCIAGVVIYTLTAWIPLNHIGNNIVRIILKGIALIIVILVEFAVWINATLPWLQEKTYKPTIRRVDE